MNTIARLEFGMALRNHWLQGYALLLAALGMAAAWAATSGAAGLGVQMFGRTAASLTNLCLLLAPLVALMLGAAAVAGERDRGTLERLLAQPLSRQQLLVGKYVGLLVSLVLATGVGFLPAGIQVTRIAGAGAATGFLVFPALAVLVIAAMLGVGLLISVRSRTGAQAQARAVFVWFALVILFDLVLMGTLMTANVSAGALALLLLANPINAGRVLVVLALETDLYLLGPAGAWLVDTLGRGGAVVALLAALAVWAMGSLALALISFRLGGGPRLPRRLGGNRARPTVVRPSVERARTSS